MHTIDSFVANILIVCRLLPSLNGHNNIAQVDAMLRCMRRFDDAMCLVICAVVHTAPRRIDIRRLFPTAGRLVGGSVAASEDSIAVKAVLVASVWDVFFQNRRCTLF